MFTCMFDLYKMNRSAQGSPPAKSLPSERRVPQVRSNNSQNNDRDFKQGMELFRQGLDMMKPPE